MLFVVNQIGAFMPSQVRTYTIYTMLLSKAIQPNIPGVGNNNNGFLIL